MRTYLSALLILLVLAAPSASAQCNGLSGNGPGEWLCGGPVAEGCSNVSGSTRIEVSALDLNGGVVAPGDTIELTVSLYNMASGNYGHYFRSCMPSFMEDRVIVRGPFNWSMGACDAADLSSQYRLLVGMTAWEPCENPVWMRYTMRVKSGIPTGTVIRVVNQAIQTHNPYSSVIERLTKITVGKKPIPVIYE